MNPNSPFNHYTAPAFIQATPGSATPRGRGRGSSTGAKRGRKPRGSLPNINVNPRPLPHPGPSTTQPTTVQWAQPITQMPVTNTGPSEPQRTPSVGVTSAEQSQGTSTNVTQSQGTVLSLPGTMPVLPVGAGGTSQRPSGATGVDEDGDGEDELLPAMADDDFAAQSSWNSQSKDNLKWAVLFIDKIVTDSNISRVLMDNFSPEQYDRFEAYRRHALPKQAVRKV